MKKKIFVCVVLSILFTVFAVVFVHASEKTEIPGVVESITSSNVSDGLKISWQSVEGATHYNVYKKSIALR